MTEPSGFAAFTQRILSLFTKREVKTPLGFYYRCIWAIIAIVGISLYVTLPEQRFTLILFGLGFLVLLVIVVGVFAWFKPTNLVYGETGHRAEFRIAMGTEQSLFTASEVKSLPGISNPNARILPDLPNPGEEPT